MDDGSEGRASITPADPERLREVLDRAVRKLCPRWLAADRDDLVQAASIRVLEIWRKSEESRRLGTSYLWRVAHSTVLDELRRRGRRRESAMEDHAVTIADPAPGPEQRGSGIEMRRAIEEGLGRLSASRRAAVALYLYGFSLEHSARALGWNTKKVDNMRYQGLAELREFLRSRGFAP